MKLSLILLALLTTAFANNQLQGPTKVGNGDDGSDLEGFTPITSGKILEARKVALSRLQRLNVQGIEHLSGLIPEVENSKLFITKRNISAKKLAELGAFHSGEQKYVYARTFPRAYAATRFFPAALDLDLNQLSALHIHEALHRSLPKNVREDEEIVSKITLAIVDPMATHDQVKEVTIREIGDYSGIIRDHQRPYKVDSYFSLKNYSTIKKNGWLSSLKRKVSAHNHIYPFKSSWSLIGFGAGLSHITTAEDRKFLGPLSLMMTADLFTMRGFDITLFSNWNRSTRTEKSYENSGDAIYSRDSFKVGAFFKGKSGDFVGVNKIEYTFRKKNRLHFEEQSIDITYGSILHIEADIRYQIGKLQLGALGQFFLIGESVDNGLVSTRSSVLGLGPIVSYSLGNLSFDFELYKAIHTEGGGDVVLFNDILTEGWAQDHLTLKVGYKFQ